MNRNKALKYLRARVFDHERRKRQQSRNELRTAAQGTGDRSDKIRTYNFPQDRVSDHRISFTIPGVDRVMVGEDLIFIVQALLDADEREGLSLFLEHLEKKNGDGNSKKTAQTKKSQ